MELRARLQKYRKFTSSKVEQPQETFFEVREEILQYHPQHSGLSLVAPAQLYFTPDKVQDSSKILFLDVECLSLGMGPANIPWLIGTGAFCEAGFHLRLLLCHTPPAEVESLAFLDELWAGYDTILTYNGASFDIPLLKSRYILYRKQFPQRVLLHYDLYRILRRIYPTKPQRLVDAEEHILGFCRLGDLPGSYAGQAYFEYLRYGRRELLEKMIRHNQLDVVTLAALALKLDEAIRQVATGKVVWAPKMHKLKEAPPHFVLQSIALKGKLDGEDCYLAGKAHERLGHLREAIREYCRAARLAEHRAVLPLLKGLIKLKKEKIALTLTDYFLARVEASLQEKLLVKRRLLLKAMERRKKYW